MKKRTYKIVLVLVSCLYAGFAEAQQLQSYIQEAESNNPDIQAYKLRYNIAEEKVNEVNSLRNTEFGAGYFISEPETRTGAQRARFSVKQMLPWFGTITARENYASSMADAEYVEIAIAKRKLALSVSQSYYQLYAITAKQEVLDENIQLLKTYERLALTSVEVGKASAVDVLRLQIRQNELEKEKDILVEDFLAEKVQFNNLLNKAEKAPISVVDTMIVPLEKAKFSSEDLKLHPEILKYDKLFESIAESEALNQKESLPNIGVGLDYIPVAERPAMNFSDNGKDILMPMVSISIPIFNNKYSSHTKQNELRQQEITAQKQDRLNKLKTLFTQAIQNRNSARISYETQLKNLKQANDAEDILMKSYETGTVDFNDVLDIQELQLKFQTNQIESVKMYFTQSSIINYLTN